MTDPAPYLYFSGDARAALEFYGKVFGCAVQLHSFSEFDRDDGPADAIAHGYLVDGPVALFAADAASDQQPFRAEGLMFALLGTESASVLRDWFARLSQDGRVVEPLQRQPWGAFDGQVVDRFGVHWLVGFEDE